jgi:ABC-2 type transport system permease protein
MAKLDLLGGYALAFGTAAIAQAVLVSAVALGPLGLNVEGSAWLMIGLSLANALLGMALGLFVSAFARTEFQAVQFLPAFILPQVLLCGLLADRGSMARPLELVSEVAPMTYAYDGLDRVTRGVTDATLAGDALLVVGFTVLALTLGALTLRRRTA